MQPNNLIADVGPKFEGVITNPTLGDPLKGLVTFADPAAYFNLILPHAVGLCFVIASVIFFFMIITGAIQWISSGGDKQGLEAARGKLSNAIIGLVILFSSFALIQLIESFFGIKILTIDIGPLVIQ